MQLPFHPDFTGKVAVVTGGSGVLCSEFCRALAACGAKVAIVNRTAANGQRLADEITAAGGIARAFPADVTDRAGVEAAHQAILEAYGACDILINGAGGNDPKATTSDEFFDAEVLENTGKTSFFDLDPASFGFVFSANIVSMLLPTQCFGRDMVRTGSGTILNISSMSAYTPLTRTPAYSAAKAAVSNFTQWLATYLSTTGIRVNAIAPGFFSTAQNRALLWNADGTPTARSKKILAKTPMGRFGEPQELIGTLLYLLDDACSGFVSGIVVPVDGGFSAYSGV